MSTSDIPAGGATSGRKGSTFPDKKLDSWGEIASYLGREVRTVQRWEQTEDLPVHRHEHKKKSTVYAFSGELDAWISSASPRTTPKPTPRSCPSRMWMLPRKRKMAMPSSQTARRSRPRRLRHIPCPRKGSALPLQPWS